MGTALHISAPDGVTIVMLVRYLTDDVKCLYKSGVSSAHIVTSSTYTK